MKKVFSDMLHKLLCQYIKNSMIDRLIVIILLLIRYNTMIDSIENYIIFNYYLINEVILLSKTNVLYLSSFYSYFCLGRLFV